MNVILRGPGMRPDRNPSFSPVAAPGSIAFALLAASLLLACGSSPDAAKDANGAQQAAAPLSPDAYLVSAVKAAPDEVPVALRFELQQRPVVGEEFTLRIRAETAELLTSLQVKFEVPEGLSLSGAASGIQEAKVPAQARMDRTLKIRAFRDGVYELRAAVAGESATGMPIAAMFSIPVIVDRPPAR